MKEIICKSCFFRDKKWCKLIEDEYGGSIIANQTECPYYLKKGTEPKWLCWKCGTNTYGESATHEGGRIWCSDCYNKEQHKQFKAKEKARYLKNIKKVNEIIKDKKTAKIIVDSIDSYNK
jgi:hypothetical protein